MKQHTTLYGLVGVVANIGGLVSAGLVLVISSFQGVGGQALAIRVGLAFLVVTVVFHLVGFITVRSLLTAIVSDSEARKSMADSKRRAGESS